MACQPKRETYARPDATPSPLTIMTIGIAVVACLAACTPEFELVTRT